MLPVMDVISRLPFFYQHYILHILQWSKTKKMSMDKNRFFCSSDINNRVGWGKMSMVGQSESEDAFVSGVTVKELMITGSSVLLFLFQLENKNVYHHGFSNFWQTNENSQLPVLPHPTLILILPHESSM